MPQADELLSSGDIEGARSLLFEQVRSDPGDFQTRMFLFQISALTGEWKRAKSQLELLTKLDPAAQMLSVAYSQCIEAEILRAEIFAGNKDISFLADTDWAAGHIENVRKLQSGNSVSQGDFSNVFNHIPDSPGVTDGDLRFDWVADADPRFGPSIEAIIGGRYGLMPFEALENLTIHEPRDLKDTIWIQAEFALRQGAKVAGFLPVRYPGSEASSQHAVVTAKATEWTDNNGIETALGHRLLMFSDGSEIALTNLRKLTFEETESGA